MIRMSLESPETLWLEHLGARGGENGRQRGRRLRGSTQVYGALGTTPQVPDKQPSSFA